MKQYKLLNNVVGGVVFLISLVTYLLTIEPTASFWDCGEFISTAYKLEIGHPPGAPFFMLMARFFTLFASDVHEVAKMVNIFSAFMSALTILFLFWTITHLARRLVIKSESDFTLGNIIAILGAGTVGALAYTFSDTFWFSAVEAEVYASSSMFTAVVFWAMLKWEDVADRPYANRWLVLIAYLMGLSIAVHLLNLLSIPVLVLVYYFRKFKFSWKGVGISLAVSVVLLAVILYGIIPGFVTVAGWFELLFVNVLGFSFNTGVIIYSIALISCLVGGIYTSYSEKFEDSKLPTILFIASVALLGIPFFGSHIVLGIVIIAALAGYFFFTEKGSKTDMSLLNTMLTCLTVILLGYSSYATLVIRSNANPPMDQNSPDDVFTLKSYLNREQYGDTPLLYGESFASEFKYDRNGSVAKELGEDLWAKKIKNNENEPDEYYVYDQKTKYVYQNQFLMFFPRMYSRQGSHISAYKSWSNFTGQKIKADDGKRVEAPTFGDNMTYFLRYQVGFMYWRYFMWNFVGRQNDIQGHGEITHGNWISGIDFLDELRLGDQSSLPDDLKNNKGRNCYYFLPLILGLLGILYQFNKERKGTESFLLVSVLFFMTGLAIVVYLNQYPFQPRERDYAYAGSFYAFCIWIGLGVLWIFDLVKNYIDKRIAAALATLLSLSVPTIMAVENWDDHDRSGRYTCRDYGANYLKTIPTNGIIFTNGDNDTFPLWYNQEVEGVGTDCRVANLSYLQMAWYIDQMQKDAYDSKAIPMSMKSKDYSNGKLDVAYIDKRIDKEMTIDEGFKYLLDKRTAKQLGYREGIDVLPTTKLVQHVDKDAVVAAGLATADDTVRILKDTVMMVNEANPNNGGKVEPHLKKVIMDMTEKRIEDIKIDLSKKSYLGKQDLFILDIIRSNKDWKTPIYFAVTVGRDSYLGLDQYLELEGMAYRLVPYKTQGGVNTEVMYDNMMNKFEWGNVSQPGIYMDENNCRMARTFRHMFVRLASELAEEGKKSKAIEVLDKCMKEIPTYNVPTDLTSCNIAHLYASLGEKEKAEVLIDEIFEICKQYRVWNKNLTKEQRKSASEDINERFDMMRYVAATAVKACSKEKADEIRKEAEDFYQEVEQ
ncbi:MAG: DUF2723 domain-containing protein [Bacteroidales bacterium]|jgi:hypothetical protein|nr:DUF2723 domain-containing protein [Bacteroidales bacterium]